MPRYLHLLKADSPALAGSVIAETGREPGTSVTVVLLDAASPPSLPEGIRVLRLGTGTLDHSSLLDLIFDSDRVVCW